MRKFTVEDYHRIAAEHGLEWIGKHLPESVLHKTLWRCKRAGHVFSARLSNVQNFSTDLDGVISGRSCPYCSGRWRKTVGDYEEMAKRHGLTWVGSHVPSNTKNETEWMMPDGEIIRVSYRALSSRRTPVSVTGLKKQKDREAR